MKGYTNAIKNDLSIDGFKEIKEFEDYYINNKGVVYKIFNYKNKNSELRLVSSMKDAEDSLKANFILNGVRTTRRIKTLVYEIFNKPIDKLDKIYFIDGDTGNCDIKNLISGTELLDYYKLNKK